MMKALAGFVMQRRIQAVAIIVAATLFQPLVWLGGGTLALVTLRRGTVEGLLAAVVSAAIVGLGLRLLGIPPFGGLIQEAGFWLPLIVAAVLLRAWISLALALEGAVAVMGMCLLLWHLFGPPASEFWAPLLPLFEQGIKAFQPDLPADKAHAIASQALQSLTGIWVLGTTAMAAVSLLLGRYWQSLLYNPGGFGREFRALRFGRGFALLAAGLLAAATVAGPGPVYDLAMLVVALFVFQALAALHGLVVRKGRSGVWLVPAYLTLFLVPLFLPLLGLMDVWIDFRHRFDRTGAT